MIKITKANAKKIYNSGKSIYLSSGSPFSTPKAINKRDGVDLQWGVERDFDAIVKDFKFFNKKNPTFYTK